jgi:succinate dehydrogenase/fumarate reductase cytochrome b subunit
MIGIVWQLLEKYSAIKNKAKISNAEMPTFWAFVTLDKGQIFKAISAVVLVFFIFGSAIDPDNLKLTNDINMFLFTIPQRILYEAFLTIVCATMGYHGQGTLLRLFSKTNNMVNKVIDEKTTRTDAAEGHLNHPTPLKK